MKNLQSPQPPKRPKLSVNVPTDMLATLDELVARLGPFATRHGVHLIAFRLGLDALLADPTRVNRIAGLRG